MFTDPKAGVAQTLAHIYQWHCRRQPHQREPLSEQHGHPEAAQWGSLWLFQRTDDPGQGKAPERQVRVGHVAAAVCGMNEWMKSLSSAALGRVPKNCFQVRVAVLKL